MAFEAAEVAPADPHVLALNLLKNGGFESPVVTKAEGWNIYSDIEGWDLLDGPYFELQRGILGGPAEGKQHLELDGDTNGPGGERLEREQGSITIAQTVDTATSAGYALQFAYRGRPNTPKTDNVSSA